MMILRITAVTLLLACAAQAVLNKEFKRREAFDTYGPPRPAPQYGPPPQQQQHTPHREYGVPQQIPFREYGPPAIKYGPPKLNFIGGGGGGSASNSFSGGLHEQIKTHFGVPKPFYGPPHISHKPAGSYGPPPQPQAQYGPPPKQQYGPPPQPQAQYGPPPRPQPQYGPPPPQHKPAPSYGPPPQAPRPSYGPPPQPLPSHGPAPLFKPPHQPATSYGPPPSGPIGLPPKPVYGPPKPQYGPPQLPQLPGPHPAGPFNKVQETTIILTGGNDISGVIGGGGGGGGHHGGPGKQVQIQIDGNGHTHSVSGSQAPFHTACDGWKPIPAPVGAYVENNNIETQGGYSQVSQLNTHAVSSSGSASSVGASLNFGTQYSGGSGDVSSSGGSIIDGLTDEQLVAVALQSGGFDGPVNNIQEQGLPVTGPAVVQDYKQHGLNSVEAEALQLSLGSIDDSYNKPPADSYAPGSAHAQKYQGPPPGGNYGPPPRPPPPQHHIHHHHHQQQQQQQQHNGAAHFVHQHQAAAQAGLGIHYGSQSGNVHPFPAPPHGGAQPNRPVAYRPPVPQGLLESIGATVQHLDQFGVKPPVQPPTYIPPATNEFPQSGPGNVGPEYGPPQQQQQQPRQQLHTTIIEQQLPQQQTPQQFVQQQQHSFEIHQQQQQQQQQQQSFEIHQQQQQQQQQHQSFEIHLQQQQHRNEFESYGPPPPPTGPQAPFIPPPPVAQPPPAQYLPPQQQQHIDFNSAGYENAVSHSQYNHQYQQLPLQQQQQPRFHDCGHGPNLVGAGYQFQQQQQQQVGQQYSAGSSVSSSIATSSVSSGSANAFNAISQSIPVHEQHTQFISVPTDSYGPPASGNDIDHIGYASQKNEVSALPDGTDSQNLPGLEGLNVISAQKSESIQLSSNNNNNQQQQFQLQFASGGSTAEQTADHEEILSQGLLQSILTAIEQPQANKKAQQQQIQQQLEAQHAPNHLYSAQSRSDIDVHEDGAPEDAADEPALGESKKVEVKVKLVAASDDDAEEPATVKEIKPIVAAEVDESVESAKH